MANLSFRMTFRVTRYFFDNPLIVRNVGEMERKKLSRVGAFLRTRARSLLRRRKRPSLPGKPPSVHSTDATANLKNILFAYDSGNRSVVVGPVALNQINMTLTGSMPVPEILEYGGTVAIREWRFDNLERLEGHRGWARFVTTRKFTNEWRRADLRWRNASRHRRGFYLSQLGVETRVRRVEIAARPFMRPAYELERETINQTFRGGLTASA